MMRTGHGFPSESTQGGTARRDRGRPRRLLRATGSDDAVARVNDALSTTMHFQRLRHVAVRELLWVDESPFEDRDSPV